MNFRLTLGAAALLVAGVRAQQDGSACGPAATQDVCAWSAALGVCVKKPCTISGVAADAPSEADLAMCAVSGAAAPLYQSPVRENETWTFSSSIPIVYGAATEGGNFLSNVYLRLKSVGGCSASELAAVGGATITKSDDGRVTVNVGSYALASIDANDAAVRACSSWSRVDGAVDGKFRAALDSQCPYWNDDVNCATGTRVERPNGETPPGGYSVVGGTIVYGNPTNAPSSTNAPSPSNGPSPSSNAPTTSVISISRDENDNAGVVSSRASTLAAMAAASAAMVANGQRAWPMPLAIGAAAYFADGAHAQSTCRIYLEATVTDLPGVDVVIVAGMSGADRTLTFSTRNKKVISPGEMMV